MNQSRSGHRVCCMSEGALPSEKTAQHSAVLVEPSNTEAGTSASTASAAAPHSPAPIPLTTDEFNKKRNIGYLLLYGTPAAVIVGVGIGRGRSWAGYVSGQLLAVLALVVAIAYGVGRIGSLARKGNFYIVAGTVMALVGLWIGLEQVRAAQEDSKMIAAARDLTATMQRGVDAVVTPPSRAVSLASVTLY
jgi:hypothetical protein